jgi:hypothetical protein
MAGLLAAFLAEVGLITYRDLAGSAAQKAGHTIVGLPLPADYLAAVAFFGALGLVPKDSGAAKVAALVGWGIVIATATNVMPLVTKNQQSTSAAPTTQKATVA